MPQVRILSLRPQQADSHRLSACFFGIFYSVRIRTCTVHLLRSKRDIKSLQRLQAKRGSRMLSLRPKQADSHRLSACFFGIFYSVRIRTCTVHLLRSKRDIKYECLRSKLLQSFSSASLVTPTKKANGCLAVCFFLFKSL